LEQGKDQNVKELLIKNLPDSLSTRIESVGNTFHIRIVSKDSVSEGASYIEFKSQGHAERAFSVKQGMGNGGSEIDGLAIILDHIRKKSKG
jgi:hypothetical protein